MLQAVNNKIIQNKNEQSVTGTNSNLRQHYIKCYMALLTKQLDKKEMK